MPVERPYCASRCVPVFPVRLAVFRSKEGQVTTTTPTFAAQRDEFNAGLAEQAPAEVLEGFGRIIADQATVDYAARAPKVGERAPGFTLPDQLGRPASLAGELEHKPVVLIFGSCT